MDNETAKAMAEMAAMISELKQAIAANPAPAQPAPAKKTRRHRGAVTIDGVEYRNKTAAMAILGMGDGEIDRAIEAGTIAACSRTVVIDGVIYRNALAAKRALRIGDKRLQQSVKDGTLAPIPTRLRRLSVPCTIDGVEYPSQKEASRATGIHRNRISMAAEFGVLHLLKPVKDSE